MLLGVLVTLFSEVFIGEGVGVEVRPCSFPLPLELPKRNDRSEQCWLRIEDDDLVETTTVLCYVAHDFLRSYIHDYNTEKMKSDGVNVALWSEEARPEEQITPKATEPKGLKDWRLVTVLDPITHKRFYVSNNADCRLIMYTREAMTNYKINCETILFYVNERMRGGAAVFHLHAGLLIICIFLVFVSINFV